jgi:two-component system CheB/CheR fusion protein
MGALQPGRLSFPVVGIGSAAGSVAGLTALFERLPEGSGMAFVVMVYLPPEHASAIDRHLARVTPMTVLRVTQSIAIEPDHVYVIPPGGVLSIADGRINVAQAPGVGDRSARPISVDMFFRTLAEAHRERAVAIVLTGAGSDGALGIKSIKEYGGVTLAQSPGRADYDAMPANAIATGAVDFVLPAAAMGQKLVSLWENARGIELPLASESMLQVEQPASRDATMQAEAALRNVMALLRQRTGHDFSHYKRATVLRRLERRLQVNGLQTLPDYSRYLEAHPDETPALLQDLLISVTRFFRDGDAFRALESAIDSAMLASGSASASAPASPVALAGAAQAGARTLRAWIAGCATGEEAYSIAMLLSEYLERRLPSTDLQVFGSDIDEHAITVARVGVYSGASAADIAPARRQQFFRRDQASWRVRRELREKILFSVHNVLHDPPFSHQHLVCCRNLLIYLDRSVQFRVLETLHAALVPGGLLFLGGSETADAAGALFSSVDPKHKIYRANAVQRGRWPLPIDPVDGRSTLILPAPLPRREVNGLSELHAAMRERYAPPSVLIDDQLNVLHSSPSADRFLRFATGQPSRCLLDLVPAALRLELRNAIHQASQSSDSACTARVSVPHGGGVEWVAITVRPISEASALMLVLFDVARGTIDTEAPAEGLPSIDEELRSTTEALETRTEELQSVNEELITVNHALKSQVEAAGMVNDDLNNLMAATDIATLFLDRRLRVKRFTPPASKLLGLASSDVGRSLLDIPHPLDYPQLEQDVTAAFESLRVVEREVLGPQGAHYLVRALPYRTQADLIDGVVVTFIDITATRRAEERLQAGERHMRMVIDSTQDYAIITCDVAGMVTGWNTGAAKMFGYTEAEMVGQPFATIFTPTDRANGVPDDELRRARDNGRASDERWHQRKDGSTFYCSGIVTPMFDNTLIGYAKIARDLSDAKRTEEQLEASLVKETQMRAELQAASALKDDFLAVVSHELKHPLNLINVNAELLSRTPEVRNVPAVARAADVIRRTVMSQAKIIDDLLDLSRVQTGKLTLEIAPMDWGAVVARVVGAVADDARTLALQLGFEASTDATRVLADSVRVEQIVWNLISNALKFTPAGGRIDVTLSAEGPDARLDVADTGRGIAADFMPHVFDLFRQADRGTTRTQGGMGIGLALVKNLVEAQGGRVAVASEGTGRGARFSVWLPLAGEPAQGAMEAGGARGVASMRILLVDDTLDALESFATLLRLEGATVATASSAKQALTLAMHQMFDLLVSDVAMPEMDGYALMQRLRALPATAQLPAIALTGFGRPQDELRAKDAGFNAHLTKPVRLEALIEVIARLRP